MKMSRFYEKLKKDGKGFSIQKKILLLAAVVALPFIIMLIYLLASMANYSMVYDKIVRDITIANNYNLNFKEDMDESMYKLVVGYVTFDNISEDEKLENPYVLIEDLRSEFTKLIDVTTDSESRVWLESLLRNINTLEKRVDDIVASTQSGGTYDDNIENLENNIYVVTVGDYTIAHTGDQYNKDDLEWLRQIKTKIPPLDVLLVNCWAYSLYEMIEGFAPKLVITGHENELGHSIDHRESYWLSYNKLEKLQTPSCLMTWGECFWYGK